MVLLAVVLMAASIVAGVTIAAVVTWVTSPPPSPLARVMTSGTVVS